MSGIYARTSGGAGSVTISVGSVVGVLATSTGTGGAITVVSTAQIIPVTELADGSTPPGTIFVNGPDLVASYATLTLSPSPDENSAVVLAEPVGGPDPTFIDDGKVVFTATTANTPLIAFEDGSGGDIQAVIDIGKGGSFTESSTGAGSYATGYISAPWSASFENDGTFSVTAAARALGLELQNNSDGSFVNTGAYSITGDVAIGVIDNTPGQITNGGDLEVHGTSSAVGIEIQTTPRGQITNSGILNVQAGPGGSSEGIVLDYGPYDNATIDNSGTITSQKAITLGLGDFSNNGVIVLDNSGTINGDIDLGLGTTTTDITNSGAINGAIHLENSGDNIYTGYAGTLTGPIYLGSGTQSDVFLGNDGETVYGGSGKAYVQLGDGSDTVVSGSGQVEVSYGTASAGVTVDLGDDNAQITGGGGTDTLENVHGVYGSPFDDVLTAAPTGSDMHGNGGDDTFVSGAGNDTITGGSGYQAGVNTVVFSGAYADYAIGQAGGVYTVSGPDGTDTLTNIDILKFSDAQVVIGSNVTVTARNGGDTLLGGAGDDTLVTAAGTDTVDGGGGQNTAVFSGGAGDYTIDESAGLTVTLTGTSTVAHLSNIQVLEFADEQVALGSAGTTLTAPSGGDTLIGGSGNDTIIVGSGDDTIDGGDGTDRVVFSGAYSSYHLSQNGSSTIVTGSSGTTTLTNVEVLQFSDRQMVLRSGGESLTARSGGDTLVGGPGDDTLTGGAGNDTIIGGGGNDHIDGGGGTDTVVFSGDYSSYHVTSYYGTISVQGPDGTDTVTNVENFRFADQTLLASNVTPAIVGTPGADTLNGTRTDDTIEGLAGNDTLDGGLGNDVLDGGPGSDTASYADATLWVSVNLNLSGPQDTVGGGIDTLISIENVTGSPDDDTLIAGPGGSVLRGLAGDDILVSGPGADTLDGGDGHDYASYALATSGVTVSLANAKPQNTHGAGTDTLISIEGVIGSDFKDTLTAGPKGSNLDGGGGDDILKGGAGSDLLYGGAGDDTLNGGGGTNTAVYTDLFSAYHLSQHGGVTTVTGPEGTDTLQNVQILRFADRQMVLGQSAETLTARGGGDTLVGGPGNDHLVGGWYDTLIGGAGHDTMSGGGGQDTFVFNALSDSKVGAPDLITEWGHLDRIDLSAIDADSKTPGDQAFHFGATAGHTGDVVVRYDAAHDRTVIDLYVNSDSKADAEIWISGNHSLSAADFVL